jgi:hypothetical protein
MRFACYDFQIYSEESKIFLLSPGAIPWPLHFRVGSQRA